MGLVLWKPHVFPACCLVNSICAHVVFKRFSEGEQQNLSRTSDGWVGLSTLSVQTFCLKDPTKGDYTIYPKVLLVVGMVYQLSPSPSLCPRCVWKIDRRGMTESAQNFWQLGLFVGTSCQGVGNVKTRKSPR